MSSRLVSRIIAIVIGAIFILAGLTKILALDGPMVHIRHLQFADLLRDLQHLSFGNPLSFARDVDNYKMLPWPAAVAFGLYLPWLEILCGLALIIRRRYRGSLIILT